MEKPESPTPETIDNLLRFIPILEDPSFKPGEWSEEEGVWPSFSPSKETGQFERACYEGGFILASFSWPDWQDKAVEYYEHPEKLKEADLEVICKLLTTHLRKERFCEGHLEGMFKEGHIFAILKRLKEIRSDIK